MLHYLLDITKLGSTFARMRNTKRCAAEVCARGIHKIQKRSTMVPFPADTDLGTTSENYTNRHVFQLSALAVGHGQLPKPLKTYTV